jgi:hypothetical protein
MNIDVDAKTADDLRLLAGAWGCRTMGEAIQRLVADTRGKVDSKPMSSPPRKAESTSVDFNPDLDAVGPRFQTA